MDENINIEISVGQEIEEEEGEKVEVEDDIQNELDVSYSSNQSFDPFSREKNCCIELHNNNKINIQYKDTWTIRNLINAIVHHREFKKLYPGREWQLKSKNHIQLFDLHIAFYRSLKPDKETKIHLDISLGLLYKMRLLKSNRYPFFIFKENSNKTFHVKEDNPFYITKYQHELPRVNSLFFLEMHPDIAFYYNESKQAINNLSTFNLSPLITEKDDLDWFIYDDESINFIISMEKEKIDLLSTVKFLNDKVYFEDKFKQRSLSEKDIGLFFFNVSYYINNDRTTTKIKLTTKMTGMDVLIFINNKVKKRNEEYGFDVMKKILKVRGLNDYIFSANEKLINFAYINECISENKTTEFDIIDHPFNNLTKEEEQQLNEDSKQEKKILFDYQDQQETSLIYMNVMNIASYNEAAIKPKQRATIIKRSYNMERLLTHNTLNNFQVSFLVMDENKSKPNQLQSSMTSSTNITHLFSNKYRKKNSRIFDDKPKTKYMLNEFIESDMTNINFAELHKRKREPINIKTINRPFSIMLCTADFDSKLNPEEIAKEQAKQIEFENEIERDILMGRETVGMASHKPTIKNKKKEPDSDKNLVLIASPPVIIITMELFCGLESFSDRKQIRWKSDSFQYYPSFNKRIYFDRNYNILPNFLTLVFTVKKVSFSKEKSLEETKTIAWGTFRLFDHNKRLKTGLHKLCLFHHEMTEDSYFTNYDNTEPNATSICFEIESFSREVVNTIIKEKQYTFDPSENRLDLDDISIINKSPFEKLTPAEKEILWSKRHTLLKLSSCLPRLLSCADYSNPEDMMEIEKILMSAPMLSIVESLNLLTIDNLHESIRAFAVKWLKKESPIEIQKYLLQLVQGLKYEMNHDSELARFLLTIAINYPLTIGHNLFWFLRAEMAHQNVQQRFGLYLEVFLNKIGSKIKEIYEDEDWLIKELYNISRIPHNREKTKEVNATLFKEALTTLNDRITRDYSLPLNFKLRIKKLNESKCKVMKSKKLPLWLNFENADPNGENITVMFKQGDDLRMDMVTLQLFKLMQNIWSEHQLDLKMNIYGVICTGDQQGMLEMVKDSYTIANIHSEEGGLYKTLSSQTIMKWQSKNHVCSQDEFVNNFLLSSVPYSIATFILGITDRHSDNIMMKKNGELFHIDFGHFLGHYKSKFGYQRETTPFVFTNQFKSILDSKKRFNEFKEKLTQAYQLIVSKNEMIIILLKLLLGTGISELTEQSIRFLEDTLQINNGSERQNTSKYIQDKLESSLSNVKTYVNFVCHSIANAKKK